MRRRRALLCTLVALVAAAPASAAKPASWAQAELNAVVAAGVMAKDAAARPDQPLTRGVLESLVAGLTKGIPIVPATPNAPVTVSALDGRLVGALGLSDASKLFNQAIRNAGLVPPSRFGTETVARLLGLRTNHPAAEDALELLPTEPATRAEAAFSAAQILKFNGSEDEAVRALASTFALPPLTSWQKRILTTAIGFIGYPYVWGGESEFTDSSYGPQVHGGFDCSGFVWRVYKLQLYPGEGSLADTLRGRTTYVMSAEVPKSKRIPLEKLQPADVVFFGSKGPASKPAQIGHMGIYLGGGWFIQSSRHGVSVDPLSGWYRASFAWGRRPLAEAHLSAS